MSPKAVFLDRDGVINQTIFRMGKARAPYELHEFELFAGVQQAIVELRNAGFLIIVVTNQPDVKRGWVSREKVDAINQKVREILKVDDIKCCFHVDADGCSCRKPQPGMLLEAARERDIDLPSSYMVGDRFSDVEAGKKAGCQSVLVGPGEPDQGGPQPDFKASSLLEAAHWILSKK